MSAAGKRLARERKTIDAMIALFCRKQHAAKRGLCSACFALAGYAQQRLDRCPYGEDKPTCALCPIHCYQPARREQIRAVMRYAGPRMLWRRPLLAIRHLLDERKPAPASPRRRASSTTADAGQPSVSPSGQLVG
ncbi:MAG: nitrous oxide-stimulated promoter family protein [Deltaproteobacteria bacterium]|nr:nitrous oxide-stimulated promoter family protein [Deltaproteobacteria bacterium]